MIALHRYIQESIAVRNKLIVAVLILVSAQMAYAKSARCSDAQKKGIERSVEHYLNDAGSSALSYNQVIVLSTDCAQDYAKVVIHPKNNQTDDAIIYLKNDKDDWQVLTLGTFFEPEFLAKIPKVLH